MISWCWGLALTVAGIAGVWLVAGRFQKVGWALLCLGQGLWIAYALLTKQLGFIPGVIGYALVYARNYLRCPNSMAIDIGITESISEIGTLESPSTMDVSVGLEPAVESA